jgi:Zn-dependent protease with chaperone function
MHAFSNLYMPAFFIESQFYLMLVVIMNITSLVFVIMTFIPISWRLEMKADEVAAEFGGKENIKSALLAITDKKDLKEPSETHPSVLERIKHIDRL